MEGKRASDGAITMAHFMLPSDANSRGNVHGGSIMKYIDTAAGVVASRHAGSYVVTASVDRLVFHGPSYIGELLILKASLNHVGRSSMEVGVRAEVENTKTGETRHVVSAYLTMVAIDEDGRPTAVPPLILETEDDRRRNREAQARRKIRLEEREKEK